jgi:hypothetical protein
VVPASEGARLEQALEAAPGAVRIKEIKRHDRGGYIVLADVRVEALGAILESMTSQGFRPVL